MNRSDWDDMHVHLCEADCIASWSNRIKVYPAIASYSRLIHHHRSRQERDSRVRRAAVYASQQKPITFSANLTRNLDLTLGMLWSDTARVLRPCLKTSLYRNGKLGRYISAIPSFQEQVARTGAGSFSEHIKRPSMRNQIFVSICSP